MHANFEGHAFEIDGQEWREFHVDCCKEFYERLMDTPLDERYSVKLTNDDPCYIVFGQDKSVIHQNAYN